MQSCGTSEDLSLFKKKVIDDQIGPVNDWLRAASTLNISQALRIDALSK
jgi:hypothetical protein